MTASRTVVTDTREHGDPLVVTSAELILGTNPPLPGYCTEVGTVAANPGYPVNSRPAPRLALVIGQEGDC